MQLFHLGIQGTKAIERMFHVLTVKAQNDAGHGCVVDVAKHCQADRFRFAGELQFCHPKRRQCEQHPGVFLGLAKRP